MRTSAGEWDTASWAISARASAGAAARSPPSTIRVTDRSDTSTGSAGTWLWARMNRRRPPAAQRLQSLNRLGVRGHEPHGQGLGAGREPGAAEALAARPALPQLT